MAAHHYKKSPVELNTLDPGNVDTMCPHLDRIEDQLVDEALTEAAGHSVTVGPNTGIVVGLLRDSSFDCRSPDSRMQTDQSCGSAIVSRD